MKSVVRLWIITLTGFNRITIYYWRIRLVLDGRAKKYTSIVSTLTHYIQTSHGPIFPF